MGPIAQPFISLTSSYHNWGKFEKDLTLDNAQQGEIMEIQRSSSSEEAQIACTATTSYYDSVNEWLSEWINES